MRTKLSYEVKRDDYGFNTIESKGAVLTITFNEEKELDKVYDFINALSEYTDFNFNNGYWETGYFSVGYSATLLKFLSVLIEMDRQEYGELLDSYRQLKRDIKRGVIK